MISSGKEIRRIFRDLIGLLFVFGACCCSDNQAKQQSEKYSDTSFANGQSSGKHFGAYITNDMRRGRGYMDSTGTSYFYCYIKAGITNDSSIPMHVKIAFSNEYYHPVPINGQKFKVFLQKTSVLSDKELSRILKGESVPSATFDKVIDPKEECILNIGFLTEFVADLNPIPFELFSKDNSHHFASIPDSAINQIVSTKNQVSLLLGLDFWVPGPRRKCYSIIPCGQISFP